jgi:hypothetical protein
VEVFLGPLLIGDIVLWTSYLRVCRRGERETEINGRGECQHMPEPACSSIGKLGNANANLSDEALGVSDDEAKSERQTPTVVLLLTSHLAIESFAIEGMQ